MDKKRKEEKKEEKSNLIRENDQLKNQLEDYKNKYLRALADYQNLEKRVVEEKKQYQRMINKNLLLRIITILDDIDKAEIFVKDKGLSMIKDRFIKLLLEEGIKEIEVLGKPFDPHLAEAIEIREGKEDNIVSEVLRKGYYFYNSVFRPAQVIVSKMKKENKKEIG